MSLSILPEEKILQICKKLDVISLGKFVRTSSRNWTICQEVYINKLIEHLNQRKLSRHEIKEFLDDPTSLLETIGDEEEADKILSIIIRDPRTNVTPKFFSESLKLDLFRTIKGILESGKVDPNDPEIFKNVKSYDEEFTISHNLIELIVEDSRTTPETKREYEQIFLASHSLMSGINESQFEQFNLYKYRFDPRDVRFVSEDLELRETIPEQLGDYTEDWKNVYLKTFDKPIVSDLMTFIRMSPSTEEAQEFLDRMGKLSEDEKEEIVETLTDFSQDWIYDPTSNIINHIEEEEFEPGNVYFI